MMKSDLRRPTRREFLKTAGTALGAPYVITSAALGAADRPAAPTGRVGRRLRFNAAVPGRGCGRRRVFA